MADSQLKEYIDTSLMQGKSREDIYKELLLNGWSLENIQEGFKHISSYQEKEDISKRTVSIIVTIGAILISAGVFSFIAANWQEMSREVKIAVIVALMIFCNGAGYFLKEKVKLLRTAEALFLLGAIIYGAGIFLVAQIFNIRADWPDGFMLWMTGVVAMAFATQFFSLFYLAIPLGFIAFIGYPFEIYLGFRQSLLFSTSLLLLLLSTIITFVTGLIIRKRVSIDLRDFY